MVKCPYCKEEIKDLIGTETVSNTVKMTEKGSFTNKIEGDNFTFDLVIFKCPLCDKTLFEGDRTHVIEEAKDFIKTGDYW